MVRNPTRWNEEISQSSGWHGRGIQDRVRRAKCGGRFTSHHQRTNPSAAIEGDLLRDPRPALSPTRNAGHLLQEVRAPRRNRRGREPKVVCHAGHLPRLFEEVDSATLEVVSSAGREVRAGRTMAEIPYLGTWQQGEDQEHHERRLQPCHSLGMG